MFVAVDVADIQARPDRELDLRPYRCFEILASGAKRKSEGSAGEIQVQAYIERGIPARQRDSGIHSLTINHQAGAGDDTLRVGMDDRPIDSFGEPEVVGCDDKAPGHEGLSPLNLTQFSVYQI